jgi:hypothetical protein
MEFVTINEKTDTDLLFEQMIEDENDWIGYHNQEYLNEEDEIEYLRSTFEWMEKYI